MTILIKYTFKKLLVFSPVIDFVLAIVSVPIAVILWVFTRISPSRLPLTTKTFKKLGVFPIRDHYYQPLFNHSLLQRPLNQDRNLPGVNLNVAGQLGLLENLTFAPELNSLNLENRDRSVDLRFDFVIDNGWFERGDAEFLYQVIRKFKPKKVVEIGSGQSTKIARLALAKNEKESNAVSDHICIEPYEQPWLEELGIKIIRKPVEDCPKSIFSELQDGDLLFIDSSHIIRPQGDVLFEYLEILPELSTGVIVHIHDIFTPKDYPADWIVNKVLFWNEQYLLEMLLSNSQRYEIMAGLNFLKNNHFDKLAKVCPYLQPESSPASFYFRIV